ncbi:MAG: hypothetical protein QXX08_07915 [Candidatus Bathyarchaeia archaeon]
MFYIKNESIQEAIKKLHLSGTHEYFRTYLTLKAHGMIYGSSDYIPVDTQNTAPAFTILFGVQGLPEDHPFYNPLRNEMLKDDTPRGTVQTHVKKFIDGATKTKMEWLEAARMPGGEGAWYVTGTP